ncbi:MAG: hypothetical protein ACP5G4_10980, partial [bacterium]
MANWDGSGNDPFGALLWTMRNWNSYPDIRPEAEKMIFVVTNGPPRADSLENEPLDGSNVDIRETLIRYAHCVQETLNTQILEPTYAFQVFFCAPPPCFPDSGIIGSYLGWPEMDGYSGYSLWGTEFEKGDSANDYYFIPILQVDSGDSEWEHIYHVYPYDTLVDISEKVSELLHHHLVRVWYRPGTGIEEDNSNLPDDYSISAHPNPFNSAVTIAIDGVGDGSPVPVSVEIYDLAGRRVEPVTEPVEVSGGFAVSDDANAKLPSTQTGCKQGSGSDLAPLYKGGQGGSYIWRPAESLPSGVYLVRATI